MSSGDGALAEEIRTGIDIALGFQDQQDYDASLLNTIKETILYHFSRTDLRSNKSLNAKQRLIMDELASRDPDVVKQRLVSYVLQPDNYLVDYDFTYEYVVDSSFSSSAMDKGPRCLLMLKLKSGHKLKLEFLQKELRDFIDSLETQLKNVDK